MSPDIARGACYEDHLSILFATATLTGSAHLAPYMARFDQFVGPRRLAK